MQLKKSQFNTPLGPMIAIADEKVLYLLEFLERKKLKENIGNLKAIITDGYTEPLRSIEKELQLYFNRELNTFTTPFLFRGTPFQQRVWKELLTIPSGNTLSYGEIAAAIGKPTAYRAVAQAIGSNQLAILVPCHRVINTNGNLGGYSGGLSRKEWLIQHEKASPHLTYYL